MFDLATVGYTAEEYFLSGQAYSYGLQQPLPADGRWKVEPRSAQKYVTRVVVYRPLEMGRSNGVACVEWLNVSAGMDAAADWLSAHRHLIRTGSIWVGVSAQKVGIDGGLSMDLPGLPMHLKAVDAARYGALDHPGDAWSFDIFRQAGQALRDGLVTSIGQPRCLIAHGASQSAYFLVSYVNAFYPAARVFDGYLIFGRPGAVASLDGTSPLSGVLSGDVIVREDARVPIIIVQAETDLIGPLMSIGARQPDHSHLRSWEVAGAAHADTYLMTAGAMDNGLLTAEQLATGLTTANSLFGITFDHPINSAPHTHYVHHAAFAHLFSWVAGGAAPPAAPRLNVSADGNSFVADANGNATGGVRTPWMDVPTARLSGLGQTGSQLATLVGVTEPFDAGRLRDLYPGGQSEYLKRFEESLNAAVKAGFILPEDVAENLALAGALYTG